MAKWYVKGLDENTMQPKTVIVSAPNKQQAIDKGLNKIDTKMFFECRLKSA